MSPIVHQLILKQNEKCGTAFFPTADGINLSRSALRTAKTSNNNVPICYRFPFKNFSTIFNMGAAAYSDQRREAMPIARHKVNTGSPGFLLRCHDTAYAAFDSDNKLSDRRSNDH